MGYSIPVPTDVTVCQGQCADAFDVANQVDHRLLAKGGRSVNQHVTVRKVDDSHHLAKLHARTSKKKKIRNYYIACPFYVNLNCCLVHCHLTWFKVLSVGIIRASFTFGI